MKIRSDFITNSSSSSFVAFAIPKEEAFSDIDYEKIFKEFLKERKKFYAENPEYDYGPARIAEWEEFDEDERREFVTYEIDRDDIFKNKNIEIGGMDFNWVGVTVNTIFKEFPDIKVSEIRQTVLDMLNKELKANFTLEDIHFVEEAWRDG